MKNKKNKKTELEREQDYHDFLKKRLESKNYKANVSKEEYEETKKKFDKVKLRLRLL